MILAGVVLGGGQWQWPAIGLIIVASLVVWFGRDAYRRFGRWTLWPSLGKLLALVLLGVCLVEPLWSSVRTRPGANLFLIVADDSASLTLKDAGKNSTRGEHLQQILADKTRQWRKPLEREFEVRQFSAGSRLRPITDPAELSFTDLHSPLDRTLRLLSQRFQGRPVAGILLLTDGNSTDSTSTASLPTDMPSVYPVLLGNAAQLKDVAVGNGSVSLTAFEDAPVTVTAELTHQGLANQTVVAQILDDKFQVVKEETLRLPAEGRATSLRFQLRPVEPGLSFYTLAVELKPGETGFTETTLENNRRRLAVARGSGPYRVLYVSGRPNWEFKFLNRALEADEQVDLTGLIRIAKREPKFDWRGRTGESSNPLFRGFDGDDAGTERFDQPVIIRLNTKDASELRDGFPKRAEDLFPFQAVIIDDLEAEFFTPTQFELLERFVSERGGSLLMLGGQESFSSGDYRRTPLSRVLPLSLDPPQSLAISQPPYRLTLTRDGWLQPWARLRSTEEEEHSRLQSWPAFRTMNRVGREKPGASIIAEVRDRNGDSIPAVVAHRYGAGRCATVLVGDLWRAGLEQTDEQRTKDDLGKSWRQLIRWLIADVPEQITLKSLSTVEDPHVMRLEARIRTADYKPQDNCGVIISVTLPDGSTLPLPAEPSLAEPGLYEALVAVSQPGNYRATVAATDDQHKSLGGNSTAWVIDPAADEFRRIAPDHDAMQTLADATGGELLRPEQLPNFVSTLSHRPAPITEMTTVPLWHNPIILLLIIAGLCGDWAWRRWRGLP